MRRFLVPSLITVVVAGLLAVLTLGLSDQSSNSSIDAQVARGHYPLPPDAEVALPFLQGAGRRSLADFRGKVVLLNFFASWCVPCAQESPALEQAQRMLAKHDGTVLGVTYLDNAPDDETFMRVHRLTYPVVRDVSGNFVHAFGTNMVPESFVINRSGRIQALRRFELDSQWVTQTLPKILAAKS